MQVAAFLVIIFYYRFSTISRHFRFFVEDCIVGNSYTTLDNWNKFLIKKESIFFLIGEVFYSKFSVHAKKLTLGI